MRGILQGLGLTLSHVTRPKVTRLYPYEKRKLPARRRGLIQLIQEDGQDTPFNLKCEACLLCEKICPPRAITIEARPDAALPPPPVFLANLGRGLLHAAPAPNTPWNTPTSRSRRRC